MFNRDVVYYIIKEEIFIRGEIVMSKGLLDPKVDFVFVWQEVELRAV